MDSINSTEAAPPNGGLLKIVAGSAGGIASAAAVIYLAICALHSKAAEDRPLTGTMTTRLGEHRCEKLPDASQICLNTNTVVKYIFNHQTRNVELVSGEASFEVKSGDPRPFDVLSGSVLVHDLSTSFDLYRKDRSTVVTVINGRVRLAAPVGPTLLRQFKNGTAESIWKRAPEFLRRQQVEFDEATTTLYAHRALTEEDLIRLMAWQRGRIDLNGRTLREALTEFSRYQPIGKFNIPDRSLRDVRIGGEFDSPSLGDFLETLEKTYHIHNDLRKDSDGQTMVTLSRRQSKLRGHPTD